RPARWGQVTSSVPLEIREQANVAALDAARYSDAYVPYREPVAAPSRVALSVLVPSVSARRADLAPKIADALFGQHEALPTADQAPREILMLTHSRGMGLGEKRNAMGPRGHGDYRVFADGDERGADDDRAPPPAADQAPAQILMLTDARGIVLGEKRNAMVRMAQGDYVVFVDADDRVADDYLATLLAATEHRADAITFDADVSIDGGKPKRCR